VEKFLILRKNNLVLSVFGWINSKNRIVDILRNRYQENYPKSKLDLLNVGLNVIKTYIIAL